jgi:hypothetical protein
MPLSSSAVTGRELNAELATNHGRSMPVSTRHRSEALPMFTKQTRAHLLMRQVVASISNHAWKHHDGSQRIGAIPLPHRPARGRTT